MIGNKPNNHEPMGQLVLRKNDFVLFCFPAYLLIHKVNSLWFILWATKRIVISFVSTKCFLVTKFENLSHFQEVLLNAYSFDGTSRLKKNSSLYKPQSALWLIVNTQSTLYAYIGLFQTSCYFPAEFKWKCHFELSTAVARCLRPLSSARLNKVRHDY